MRPRHPHLLHRPRLTAALVAPRCSVVHRNRRAWLVARANRAYLYEDWYRVPLWVTDGESPLIIAAAIGAPLLAICLCALGSSVVNDGVRVVMYSIAFFICGDGRGGCPAR